MKGSITHHFAHVETLDRAARWLFQIGFEPGQIEVHREGTPRISVRAAWERMGMAEKIFNAAESTDPEGWPSFWHLSRVPHPHFEPAESVAGPTVQTARSSAIGWSPPDRDVNRVSDSGVAEIIDFSTRCL